MQAADMPSIGMSAIRKAADLQSPAGKDGTRSRDNPDAPSTSDRALSDGVHPMLGAHSAVLDSARTAIGVVQPQAPDPVQAQTPGLKVRPLTEHERTFYGVVAGGLVVTAVGQGAAQQAGFRQGDVMLMLDGVSLNDTAQFYRLMHQLPHDRPVPVLVRRPSSDLFLPLGSVWH
jgi:S1-C subfamily serine protease